MTAHRKLIRPSMKDVKDAPTSTPEPSSSLLQTSMQGSGMTGSRRKQIPAEQTNAESFYYLKQMQTKTPMVILLDDGTQIRGYIEWYDRHCIKVNRHKEPNLMIMKQCIKYMYKQEDEIKMHRRRKRPANKSDKDSSEEKSE